MAALAFNRLKPSFDWSVADVDEILNKGDRLYYNTMEEVQRAERQEKDGGSTEDPSVGQTEIKSELDDANDGSGDAMQSQSFRIKTDNVKKEFSIGLNKFNMEFEDIGQGKTQTNIFYSYKMSYNMQSVYQQNEDVIDNYNVSCNRSSYQLLCCKCNTLYMFPSLNSSGHSRHIS